MIEVTIQWTCYAGDSLSRYLVDVPSDGGKVTNPFDAKQHNTAIDTALRKFRALPPLTSMWGQEGRLQERCIKSIALRQTEDEVITP